MDLRRQEKRTEIEYRMDVVNTHGFTVHGMVGQIVLKEP